MPHIAHPEQRPTAPVRPQLPRNVAYRATPSGSAIHPASKAVPGSLPLQDASALLDLPSEPILRQPNPAEYMWLAECRDHLLAPDQPAPTLAWLSEYFDRYLEQWIALPGEERWNPKAALNSISVLVGDLACRQVAGAKWVISQQGDTTSAIVAAAPHLTASPFSTVFAAWQRGFPYAIHGAFSRMVSTLIPPVAAGTPVPPIGSSLPLV